MSPRRPIEIAAIAAFFAVPVVLCLVAAAVTGTWWYALLALAPAAVAAAMICEEPRPELIPVRIETRPGVRGRTRM